MTSIFWKVVRSWGQKKICFCHIPNLTYIDEVYYAILFFKFWQQRTKVQHFVRSLNQMLHPLGRIASVSDKGASKSGFSENCEFITVSVSKLRSPADLWLVRYWAVLAEWDTLDWTICHSPALSRSLLALSSLASLNKEETTSFWSVTSYQVPTSLL